MVFIIFITAKLCYGQNWNNPVQVSNLEMSLQPDIAIDEAGVIHIVWNEHYDTDFRKVMYSRSLDEGETWTPAFDLSQNSQGAYTFYPHILSGNNGKIYIIYDYSPGFPSTNTQIFMRVFDGINWNAPILVTEYMQGGHKNKAVIDNEGRIYVFWYWGHKFYYCYFEENQWSYPVSPYESYHYIEKATTDDNNNLHCMGKYTYSTKEKTENRVLYFTFNKSTSTWSDVQIINNENVLAGGSIDLDENEKPHIVWNQHFTNSWPWINGTKYSKCIGPSLWSEEEIIDDHVYSENIIINENNIVNIFLSKDYGDSIALKHYYKMGDTWLNINIDTILSDLAISDPAVVEKDGKLYIAYFKFPEEGESNIMFSKSDLVTNISQNYSSDTSDKLLVYPNPFMEYTEIHFNVAKTCFVNINVFNGIGKYINTICNATLQPGDTFCTWNGTDKNGKSVNHGVYIIQVCKNGISETQLVYYTN